MNKNGMTREQINQAKAKIGSSGGLKMTPEAFEIRAYGYHPAEVVGKAIEFAKMVRNAKDLETLSNALTSMPSVYDAHLGVIMRAKLSGKDPVAAIQSMFVKQDLKKEASNAGKV